MTNLKTLVVKVSFKTVFSIKNILPKMVDLKEFEIQDSDKDG